MKRKHFSIFLSLMTIILSIIIIVGLQPVYSIPPPTTTYQVEIESEWWPSKYESLDITIKIWYTYFPSEDCYTYQKWEFEIDFSNYKIYKTYLNDYIILKIADHTVYSENYRVYDDGDTCHKWSAYGPVPGGVSYGGLDVDLFIQTYCRPT